MHVCVCGVCVRACVYACACACVFVVCACVFKCVCMCVFLWLCQGNVRVSDLVCMNTCETDMCTNSLSHPVVRTEHKHATEHLTGAGVVY